VPRPQAVLYIWESDAKALIYSSLRRYAARRLPGRPNVSGSWPGREDATKQTGDGWKWLAAEVRAKVAAALRVSRMSWVHCACSSEASDLRRHAVCSSRNSYVVIAEVINPVLLRNEYFCNWPEKRAENSRVFECWDRWNCKHLVSLCQRFRWLRPFGLYRVWRSSKPLSSNQ
jgi:hypothetical protein